jgi:AmmeMemoRadiSam system protein B
MDRPKLRQVDRYELRRDDEDLLVVRDPLGLAEPFAVDADFGPVLDQLDGTRTLPQIRQSLMLVHGLDVPVDDLSGFVAELSEQGLLDDDRFRELWAERHAGFLDAEVRAPMLAGVVYPARPGDLAALLARAVPPRADRIGRPGDVIGVVCPHGPPEAVGSILDATLRGLPPPESLECVIVLGTDHAAGLLPYVATGKTFETPLGRVAPAVPQLHALERRVPWIEREEIRHRDAMSIELAVLGLQHVYADRCPPIVPILCGQTVLATGDEAEQSVERFVLAMDALFDERPVLWWISAELGHAGPAYGHPELDAAALASVADRDRAVLDALVAGRADEVAALCAAAHPQGRPSGGPALTTAARLLPVGYRAEAIAYELATAPGETAGRIGRAGLRIHAPAGAFA